MTIKVFLLSLFITVGAFYFPLTVYAQGPTPTPDENNSFGLFHTTDVVTMPAGFDFTPVTLITPTQTLSITLGINEINLIGQTVTSTFALVDQYNILPTMLVVLLAIFVLRWLYKFVTGMPARGEAINVSGAADQFFDFQDARLQRSIEDEERLAELLEGNRSRRRNARSAIRFFRR